MWKTFAEEKITDKMTMPRAHSANGAAAKFRTRKNREFYGKEERGMVYFNMNSCRILSQ